MKTEQQFREIEIGNIADLTTAISKEVEEYQGPLWYRGQADYAWTLLPGYYRYNADVSEHSLMIKFRQSATMLIEGPTMNSFEWMFQMQHYGVPTRLLDWTESPLVALYFSVSSKEGKDASLWVMKPSELNKNANLQVKSEDGYLPSFMDQELENYTIESLRSNDRVNLLPVATIAIRNNPRIQAQLGTFTIHHHPRIPIEGVGDSSHMLKLKIKQEYKDKMKKELQILGISQFQLFPELSSVGAILKRDMK